MTIIVHTSMRHQRLALATRTVQVALSASGGPWGFVDAALTYAILPAGAWMAESLLGAGWRGSLRMLPNNVLVLAMLAAIGATLLRHAPDISTMLIRFGVSAAGASILTENLRVMGVIRWIRRRRDAHCRRSGVSAGVRYSFRSAMAGSTRVARIAEVSGSVPRFVLALRSIQGAR